MAEFLLDTEGAKILRELAPDRKVAIKLSNFNRMRVSAKRVGRSTGAFAS